MDVCTVCHDISVESDWPVCVAQASTRSLLTLICRVFLALALVNGRRVDFHLFDMAGSVGADVTIVDPTAPCYVKRGLDEARLLRECEAGKHNKHVFNGLMWFPWW